MRTSLTVSYTHLDVYKRQQPNRADQIDETQPIDDFLSLPYREPFTPMAEPQVKAQILT